MKIIREHGQLSATFPEYYSSLECNKLKLSQYSDAQIVDDEHIVLFSFVTNAIFLLTKEDWTMVSTMNFGDNFSLFTTLRDHGFFVDKSEDELALMDKQRHHMESAASERMKVVILPTTHCNARCEYCSGAHHVRNKMSFHTAEQVVNFIVSQADEYESIKLYWYGGEPLMEEKIITYISEEITKRLPDKALSSVITSNLALFDEAMLRKAVDVWNVKLFNVTIDGTEKEHNARKNYLKSDLNGYQHTINCIQKLLNNDVEVFCRFNIDRNNEGELTHILDDLKPFVENELFYFFVSPLRGSNDHSEFFATTEYNELFYRTSKIMIDKGFKNSVNTFVPPVALGLCLAKNKNAFVIGPTGALYRCDLDDFIPENETGNVGDGLLKNDAYNKFINWELDEKCKKCKYLPICQGGCPTEKMQESLSNSQCLKFKFKIKAISQLIVEHYS